jgi:hypothetical protein
MTEENTINEYIIVVGKVYLLSGTASASDIRSILLSYRAGWCRGNLTDLYPGSSRLESRPRYGLSYLNIFVDLLSFSRAHSPGEYHEIRHNCLL